jgi:hypothetical protein
MRSNSQSFLSATLAAVIFVVFIHSPYSVDALSAAAQTYIANSFAGANVSCDSMLDETNCTLTLNCLWNASNTSATPNGTCFRKTALMTINGTDPGPVRDSWCYEYFPQWFIATVYFLCCLSTGFAIAGMWYNYNYYDVYVTMMDGERLYNRFYFKTSPMNVYLGVLVACSFMLFCATCAYFNDPYLCSYVGFVIVFLIVCLGVPFIGLIVYIVWLVMEYLNRREMHVNLEEYIRPTTQEALPKYNNQVRCF